MRILFFTDHFKPEPSAPAAHVYERAKLWVQWGHDVTVITSCPNFPEGKPFPGYKNRWRSVEDMDGIRVVRVKTLIQPNEGFFLRILDYVSYMVSSVFFSMLEKKPDVVISTSPHLFAAAAGVIYSSSRQVPHVFEIRDLWPASIVSTTSMKKGRTYRILESIELNLYKRSSMILSLTQSFKTDLLSRNVPEDKINIVINGANLDLFSPHDKDSEIQAKLGLKNRFVIGYLGTIGLASGLENMVSAAELVKNTPITFYLVGAGALQNELKKQAREKNLDNIIFAGRQLKEDMPKYWSVCDVSLIHLRDSDVFKTVIPSKIFESMAMGLPIIYSVPQGEGSAIVERHNAGIIVPPGNPKALAEAAIQLMNNPEKRQLYANNSLSAAPLYSRKKQAIDSLDVLSKAISKGIPD